MEWISVKDKLPEKGERVIFTNGIFVGEGYLNVNGKWRRYMDVPYNVDIFNVTHWMPMPTPTEVHND